MKSYRFRIPRAAIAIAAVGMTVLTLGLTVVVPLSLASAPHSSASLASAKSSGHAPIEVTLVPSRIDVIAEREQQTASGLSRRVMQREKQKTSDSKSRESRRADSAI